MNTAVVIVEDITRTVLWLALIGSGLKLALTVAPRFQIAAPKAPVQPKDDTKAEVPKAAEGTAPAGELKGGGDVTRPFIASREAIPHDGSRRVIADGRVERAGKDATALADGELMAELGAALRKVPGADMARDAGREAWRIHQQRGGRL